MESNNKLSIFEKFGIDIMLKHAECLTAKVDETNSDMSELSFYISKKWARIIKAISGKSSQELFSKYCSIIEYGGQSNEH